MNIELLTPACGESVSLLTVAQQAMVEGRRCAKVDNDIDWENLKMKGTENSYPQPVKFSWKINGTLNDGASVKLLIGNDPAFEDAKSISVSCEDTETEVYNFHANREYFWKIAVSGPEGETESAYSSFLTTDVAPTFFRVEGITNVRDIGGWKTMDGKVVKRNRIYRGSEMDTHHALTEDGRQVLRNELKIRCDLDLRGEAEGKVFESPIGSDIRFALIPCKAYAEFMEPERFEVTRALFSLFADETAYPIYLHCWGGADRAGTLVLMLNALLGVDDESLLTDYEMTLFSIWGERSRKSDLFCQLMAALDAYAKEGSTLSEKVVSYLRAAGVTDEQMDKIRAIMLETR